MKYTKYCSTDVKDKSLMLKCWLYFLFCSLFLCLQFKIVTCLDRQVPNLPHRLRHEIPGRNSDLLAFLLNPVWSFKCVFFFCNQMFLSQTFQWSKSSVWILNHELSHYFCQMDAFLYMRLLFRKKCLGSIICFACRESLAHYKYG